MKKIRAMALLCILALLAGCTLAQPDDGGESSAQDRFVGFWAIYDSRENEDKHVFDGEDEDEQCLIAYQGNDGTDTYRTTRVGSSFGDVNHAINASDEGEDISLSGTLYLVGDGSDAWYDPPDEEVWLYDDVVESFRDIVTSDEVVYDVVGPDEEWVEYEGTQNITVYMPQDQIDTHGEELKRIAEDAGRILTLRIESEPRIALKPIHQRPEGTLYVKDDAMSYFGRQPDGLNVSSNETHSVTIDGKTKKQTVSVSVYVRTVKPLASVRMVEMNALNEPIMTTELTKAEVTRRQDEDDPYIPSKDCAYVVVEETDSDGHVTRTLYSRPAEDEYESREFHFLRYPRADKMTESVVMTIKFNETQLEP